MTLGRYADIQVFAEPDGDGVRLRYEVVPIARIARVRFRGAPALDERALRTRAGRPVRRRAGGEPAAPRWRRRSWRATRRAATPRRGSTPRTEPRRATWASVAAAFAVTPGPRIVVGASPSRATPRPARAARAPRAACRAGRSTATRSTSASRDAEDALREGGYYEAASSATRRATTGAGTADVTVARRPRRPGARSRSPAIRCRTIAAARSCRSNALRSVEEEVIEDASRNIEQYLRARGLSRPRRRRRRAGAPTACCGSPSPCARAAARARRGRRSTASAELPPAELDAAAEAGAGRAVRRRARGGGGRGAGASSTACAASPRVRVSAAAPFRRPMATATRVPVDVALRRSSRGRARVVTGVRFEGATAIAAGAAAER